MGKTSYNTQQLALEFVSVVFAVLLALFLNGWREAVITEKSLNTVKNTILQETQRNDTLFRSSLKYRTNLLEELYKNDHVVSSFPVSQLSFNPKDDKKLAELIRLSSLFGDKTNISEISVKRFEDIRVLIMDQRVFEIVIESDTLHLKGIGNIQLKTPNVNNRSWDIAQATGMLVEMDIELVAELSNNKTLIDNYLSTSEVAINIIYDGSQKVLISVLEDMKNLETDIIESNEKLIELLSNK